MELQLTEILLFTAVLAALLSFLFLFLTSGKNSGIIQSKSKIKSQTKDHAKEDVQILEVFDYLGTKIVHENGVYTVNDRGKVTVYKSWIELPEKYQKMVRELDSRSVKSQSNTDYFLESINGNYFLTAPGGKKTRYRSLSEIPAHIRKAIGK
ncbi:MAG TPA: hypothetical protein PLJ29_08910 [Leptospiraceae bacterium]|nr:hypothetical protein [Leptospiraceae bacterium]HMY67617.1 hypothetical protein [Leptospiraceae bacterium]HNF22995.1 hypothetical protein [Leptospiraceae bacterium]HNI26462.1 hypothetical protein [Leptospiraceae bacterium]HNI96524.1 hypothetical protein [Leptospiraceae bacterium]